LGSSWDFLGSKKKPKHRHHRQAKKKVQKWRRRALPYGSVMKCLRQPRNKPQRLVGPEKPVCWRWKKRKFGLAEVQPCIGLEPSTLDKFCLYNFDFLALPRLLKSLSDKELHEKNISSCLSRVAVLRGVIDLNHSGSPIDPKTMVLIWDTDASAGLTPFRSDFIDYVEVDFEVRDVTKANKVVGIGTALHKFVNNNGKDVYLPCMSYRLPTTDVRLFLPQIYHQLHGGSSTIDGANVCMRLCGWHPNITILIVCGGSNLPCVYNLFVSKKVMREYASKMRSALKASRLFTALDVFGDLPFTMPA
jgi:hypothetical protein